MKQLNILNTRDRKHILKELSDLFGVQSLPDYVYFLGKIKEEVFITTRDVFDFDVEELRSNHMGLHFGTFTKDGFILSLEGLQLLQEQISKQVYEITVHQREDWMKGRPLEVADMKDGQVAIKFEKDFLGIGIVKKGKISNTIPKIRWLINLIE